ncbi:hypothetical protein ABZ723_16160 [Streptomyces sp. NPDC006700]
MTGRTNPGPPARHRAPYGHPFPLMPPMTAHPAELHPGPRPP